MEKSSLDLVQEHQSFLHQFTKSNQKPPKKSYNPEEVYTNVGILGGGTAGYFTALTIKKFLKIPVTIIESSKIPVIGVGEATTPIIKHFLFKVLKFDKKEFYEEVEPTWKLGIKYEWGLPGNYHFNYPFGESDVLSALLYSKDINACSLNSILMSTDSSFVMDLDDDNQPYHSFSKELQHAYHLDNKKLIYFLRKKAKEAGIQFIDEKIVDASLKPNTADEIEFLVNEQGDRFYFDFFVDCSGFRSVLLEQKLGSKFISYEDSLFTDRAIVSAIPNGEKVKPYTLAETMEHGWCWNTPLRHEDHRGYVYSSAFCTDEEAYAEMLAKNPTMNKDAKVVRFRSGRHDTFIKGNVAAIGNAFAFVEPLESTGIQMIIQQVGILVNNFLKLKKSPATRAFINQDLNDHWDYLKWFLAIHYKFNKKIDSPFWRANLKEVNVAGIAPLIQLYQEIGLLARQEHNITRTIQKEARDFLFGIQGIDHILIGQGVVPGEIDNIELDDAARQRWEDNVENWKAIAQKTVPLKKDLAILLEHPHLI